MIFRTSLGIEIASKDLRIAVVRSAMGKLRVVQTLEISGFLNQVPEEQRANLANLVKRHKLPAGYVFLSLPRDWGIVRQIEFPIEVSEKLRSAIALQLETLCPWPSEDIYWDFGHEPVKKGGKTITATIVIVSKVVLDPWIEFFKAVRLPLRGACLSTVSSAHGIQALWNDATPTVVLDCEAGFVEASLVYGARLFSVTQAGDDLDSAAKCAVDRLVSLARVNTADKVRFIAYGSSKASIEPLQPVQLPMEDPRPESSACFGAIASALALIRKTAFEANLIPRGLRYRRSQLYLVPTYVLVVLAVLLGIIMLVREPYQLMVYASKIGEEIQKLAPDARELSTEEAALNKLTEKHRVISTHLQNRDFNLEALRELARVLPNEAWQSSYSYQEGTITVSGFAPTASEVQKVLEDSPLFKDVQFTSSVTRDANGKDRFTLKASLEVPR